MEKNNTKISVLDSRKNRNKGKELYQMFQRNENLVIFNKNNSLDIYLLYTLYD